MIEDYKELVNLANEKINLGKELIKKLDPLTNIDGVQRIQRRITKEIKFLEKVKNSEALSENHVSCSNLTHYKYFVEVLLRQTNLKHVDFAVRMEDNSVLRVDIVCENGSKWIKVVARSTKSLNNAARGDTNYGAKSVVDQAKNFVVAASNNLCMFKPPQVVFEFLHDMDEEVLAELKETGVQIICGSIQDVSSLGDEYELDVLNLDITTLLAYVSALTNGSYKWTFKEQILTEQARSEAKEPVKPILDKLFEGKKLICCETAVASFKEIIGLLAGSGEKQRSEELLGKIKIYPDVNEIPLVLQPLKIGGKIKPRSLQIFAFGLAMKAVTVTSNEGFIRSATSQGINIPVFVHDARALTENKEIDAMPLT